MFLTPVYVKLLQHKFAKTGSQEATLVKVGEPYFGGISPKVVAFATPSHPTCSLVPEAIQNEKKNL